MKYLFIFSLLISTTLFASPVESKIATITSNVDTNTGRFYLITKDNGDVDSVRYTNTARTGSVFEDQTYPWESVREGVVLIIREGREVVRLYLDQNFSPVIGGGVRINYLYSGVTGVRNNLYLNISRQGDSWRLNNGVNEINRLLIKGNWNVLLGLIGIYNIETSFGAATVVPYFSDDYSSSFE